MVSSNKTKKKVKSNATKTLSKNKKVKSNATKTLSKNKKVLDNSAKNEKASTKRKRIYFGYYTRIFLLLAVIFLLTNIGTKLLGDSVVVTTTKKLNYNDKGNIDYKVYLKENDYFDSDYLDKNLEYIASIIDYIETDFDYTFNVDDKVDFNYSYYVVGTLSATSDTNSSNIIYSKDYVLSDEKKLTKNNSKSFHIKEKVNVDYSKYNDIINNLKTDYALKLNSNLTLKLVVKTNAKSDKFSNSIVNEGGPQISIPLSEQTINITMDAKENNSNKTISEVSNFELVNILYLAGALVIYIIDLLFILKYLKYFIATFERNSKYEKILNKILREYDRIITNTTKLPDLNGMNIVNVNDFDELVDASERIEKPILFNEIAKGQKSKFVLVDKNIAYVYVLKCVDVEK